MRAATNHGSLGSSGEGLLLESVGSADSDAGGNVWYVNASMTCMTKVQAGSNVIWDTDLRRLYYLRVCSNVMT